MSTAPSTTNDPLVQNKTPPKKKSTFDLILQEAPIVVYLAAAIAGFVVYSIITAESTTNVSESAGDAVGTVSAVAARVVDGLDNPLVYLALMLIYPLFKVLQLVGKRYGGEGLRRRLGAATSAFGKMGDGIKGASIGLNNAYSKMNDMEVSQMRELRKQQYKFDAETEKSLLSNLDGDAPTMEKFDKLSQDTFNQIDNRGKNAFDSTRINGPDVSDGFKAGVAANAKLTLETANFAEARVLQGKPLDGYGITAMIQSKHTKNVLSLDADEIKRLEALSNFAEQYQILSNRITALRAEGKLKNAIDMETFVGTLKKNAISTKLDAGGLDGLELGKPEPPKRPDILDQDFLTSGVGDKAQFKAQKKLEQETYDEKLKNYETELEEFENNNKKVSRKQNSDIFESMRTQMNEVSGELDRIASQDPDGVKSELDKPDGKLKALKDARFKKKLFGPPKPGRFSNVMDINAGKIKSKLKLRF